MLSTNQKGCFFFNLLITAGFHQCQTLIISRHVNWPLGVVYLMQKVLDGVIQRNAITEVTSCLPVSWREELKSLWAMRTCVLTFPSAELWNGSLWILWLPPSIGDLLFLVPCTPVSSLQVCEFFTLTQSNFGDAHAVSANSAVPLWCGSLTAALFHGRVCWDRFVVLQERAEVPAKECRHHRGRMYAKRNVLGCSLTKFRCRPLNPHIASTSWGGSHSSRPSLWLQRASVCP